MRRDLLTAHQEGDVLGQARVGQEEVGEISCHIGVLLSMLVGGLSARQHWLSWIRNSEYHCCECAQHIKWQILRA